MVRNGSEESPNDHHNQFIQLKTILFLDVPNTISELKDLRNARMRALR